MANFATSQDCINYMMLRIGEATSGSRFSNNAVLYLNAAHKEMVSGVCRLVPNFVVNFSWARSSTDKLITTSLPISTGTVAITQNSTSITFSAGPAASVAGYHIVFGSSDSTMYKISTHTGGSTSAVLDSAVVSATDATSTYSLFKADYTISSDILRIIAPLSGYHDNSYGDSTNRIFGMNPFDFRRDFPTISSGEPTYFTTLNQNDGTFILRFNKYTSSYSRIEVPYISKPSDLTNDSGSIPLVPQHHRQTMSELALFMLFQDAEDTKGNQAFQNAQIGYLAMLKEEGIKDVDFQQFKPNEEVKLGIQRS